MEYKDHPAKVPKVDLVEPPNSIKVEYGKGPNNEILYPEPLEDAGRVLLRKLGKKYRRCKTCFEVFLPPAPDQVQCVECVLQSMKEEDLYHK